MPPTGNAALDSRPPSSPLAKRRKSDDSVFVRIVLRLLPTGQNSDDLETPAGQTKVNRCCVGLRALLGHRVTRALLIIQGLVMMVLLLRHALLAGFLDQNVQGKVMVIYSMQDTMFTMQQGMFSDFASVLGALKYAEANRAAAVRVHYSSPLYSDPARGENWFSYFFEDVMILRPELFRYGPPYPEEVHFNRYLARFGVYGSFTPVITGKVRRDRPYPIASAVPLSEVHRLTTSFVRPKREFMHQLMTFRDRSFNRSDFIIGIHFRGTDKRLIYPFVSPSYDTFDFYVQQVLQKYKPAPDGWKIYVATDEQEFIEHMERTHPGRIVYNRDGPRLRASDPDGNQGGVHKDTRFTPFHKGESAMVDMMMLTFAHYIIKNRSSLSDCSLAFSNVNYTFILGPNDPVFSTDFGQPPRQVMLASEPASSERLEDGKQILRAIVRK